MRFKGLGALGLSAIVDRSAAGRRARREAGRDDRCSRERHVLSRRGSTGRSTRTRRRRTTTSSTARRSPSAPRRRRRRRAAAPRPCGSASTSAASRRRPATTTGSWPSTRRARRSASAARSPPGSQPLGVSLAATPNPLKLGSGTTLAGTLSGTGNAGRKIVLQSNPWPYTQGFQNASNELLTNATGGFSFAILSVPFNTQYRVVMSERPAVVSPIVTAGVKFYVKSKVSKRRVRRGRTVRFSGTDHGRRARARTSRSRRSATAAGSRSTARSSAAAAGTPSA